MDCVNEECRIVYMNGANEANEFTQDKQQLNHCMSKFPVQNAHDTFSVAFLSYERCKTNGSTSEERKEYERIRHVSEVVLQHAKLI